MGEALRGPAPPAGGVWHVPTFTVGQYHVRMRPQRHSLVLGLDVLPPEQATALLLRICPGCGGDAGEEEPEAPTA